MRKKGIWTGFTILLGCFSLLAVGYLTVRPVMYTVIPGKFVGGDQ
jgi:hypothetical protein